jgi:type IV pilus assembly protein PilO
MSRSSLITTVWEQNRVRLILLLLLVFLAFAALFTRQLLIEPQLQRLSSEQATLQQQVRHRQMESAAGAFPVSTAQRLDTNLDRFMELIPVRGEFSLFLGDLDDWAEKAGLVLDEIRYSPERDERSGLLRYGVKFSVDGTYAQIKHFIHLLEDSERILILANISLAGGHAEKSAEQVKLNIDLTTYFQESNR